MREIKFRGYDTKLNQWIYGYYVEHIDATFNPLGNTEEENISLYEVFVCDERMEVVNNIHDLRKREEFINKISQPTKIILDSNATEEMIETAKKIYPNAEIIVEGE